MGHSFRPSLPVPHSLQAASNAAGNTIATAITVYVRKKWADKVLACISTYETNVRETSCALLVPGIKGDMRQGE